MHFDSTFPGGNIVVEMISGDEVLVHQDLRDTPQDWFYWYFAVHDAGGRTLRFRFTRSRALGVRGPAVSLDSGESWHWLGAGDDVSSDSFIYSFPEDSSEVRFSFGMPYVESGWRQFTRSMDGNGFLTSHRLCTTNGWREAEYVLVGNQGPEPDHRVAITCRHHCCEMMASYALEGLLRWAAEGTDTASTWLREHAAILAVPFVDKDGVERGDQGKCRSPYDHNRDYGTDSIYATTRAIRELLPAWSEGRLDVAMDLHCPWIDGPHNEVIYLVGSRDERIAREEMRFSEILQSLRAGPLPFSSSDFLPFGTAWNTGANESGQVSFGRWAGSLPGTQLSTAMEIPYANAGGAEVNQRSARLFGRDIGAALVAYLQAGDRPQRST
jgi:hypothetical protein